MIKIENFRKGLAALRRAGYRVGTNLSEPKTQDFWNVGHPKKQVSYSALDMIACDQEKLNARYGRLYTARKFLYLSWSGDGHEIVRLLKEAGVELGEWDGTDGQCISVVVKQVEEANHV